MFHSAGSECWTKVPMSKRVAGCYAFSSLTVPARGRVQVLDVAGKTDRWNSNCRRNPALQPPQGPQLPSKPVRFWLLRYHVLGRCLRNAVDMATLTPITVPAQPIGYIPRPADLIARIFVGVTAPADPHITTPEEVRDFRSSPARIGAGARETVNF
jgi:hypothetical protein